MIIASISQDMLVAHHEIEQHQDREQRDHDEGVIHRHQHAVDPAALVAAEKPDHERQTDG